MTNQPRQVTGFREDSSILELLDRIAITLGTDRSSLIRQAIRHFIIVSGYRDELEKALGVTLAIPKQEEES